MSNLTLDRPTASTRSVRRPATVGSYTGTAAGTATGSYTGTSAVVGSYTGPATRVRGSYVRTQR